MIEKKTRKDDIIDLAKKTKRYCDLLIEQSDSWLSEEEGLKNVEKRLSECKKKRKIPFFRKIFKTIITIFFSICSVSLLYGQDVDSLYILFSEAGSTEKIRLANEICALAFGLY